MAPGLQVLFGGGGEGASNALVDAVGQDIKDATTSQLKALTQVSTELPLYCRCTFIFSWAVC